MGTLDQIAGFSRDLSLSSRSCFVATPIICLRLWKRTSKYLNRHFRRCIGFLQWYKRFQAKERANEVCCTMFHNLTELQKTKFSTIIQCWLSFVQHYDTARPSPEMATAWFECRVRINWYRLFTMVLLGHRLIFDLKFLEKGQGNPVRTSESRKLVCWSWGRDQKLTDIKFCFCVWFPTRQKLPVWHVLES